MVRQRSSAEVTVPDIRNKVADPPGYPFNDDDDIAPAVSSGSGCKSYPPLSTIPYTSASRLGQSAVDADSSANLNTVLYLAYGSNLSAETFLGARGIRPLSHINVSVPSLRFTLDLPGIPYIEPCFANVDLRKLPDLPDKPKLPDPHNPPTLPPFEPGKWDGGLMGVVYEVTKEDYGTIIRTEGGGSGYKEIVAPCVPVPANVSVPEKPPFPEIPRPFLARTLYAPYVFEDPRDRPWWRRMLSGARRPDPEYAQASARYLKLITDGAREHDLPGEYQEYLGALQPYTVTSTRQKVGRAIMKVIGMFIFLLMNLAKRSADADGKYPWWMGGLLHICFNGVWFIYDVVLKRFCGDGEHTEETHKKKFGRRSFDEEKALLLST